MQLSCGRQASILTHLFGPNVLGAYATDTYRHTHTQAHIYIYTWYKPKWPDGLLQHTRRGRHEWQSHKKRDKKMKAAFMHPSKRQLTSANAAAPLTALGELLHSLLALVTRAPRGSRIELRQQNSCSWKRRKCTRGTRKQRRSAGDALTRTDWTDAGENRTW